MTHLAAVGSPAPAVAAVFAGQGAEVSGMGLWLGERLWPLLTIASEATGVDCRRALERGDPALRAPEVLQPVLVAVQLATHEALGVEARAFAGHSLGELAAVAAAGSITAERAVRLAALRGKLMASAAASTPGGLVACRRPIATGVVPGLALAAHNGEHGSGAWVYSGAEAAVRAALAAGLGVRVPVSGPWHSAHMIDAREAWARALADVPWVMPRAAVVMNRDGALLDATSPAAIADTLAGQLTRPIRWVDSVRTLAALGCDTFVTIGPGKVMRGLVRGVLPDALVLGSEDARDVAATRRALGADA